VYGKGVIVVGPQVWGPTTLEPTHAVTGQPSPDAPVILARGDLRYIQGTRVLGFPGLVVVLEPAEQQLVELLLKHHGTVPWSVVLQHMRQSSRAIHESQRVKAIVSGLWLKIGDADHTAIKLTDEGIAIPDEARLAAPRPFPSGAQVVGTGPARFNVETGELSVDEMTVAGMYHRGRFWHYELGSTRYEAVRQLLGSPGEWMALDAFYAGRQQLDFLESLRRGIGPVLSMQLQHRRAANEKIELMLQAWPEHAVAPRAEPGDRQDGTVSHAPQASPAPALDLVHSVVPGEGAGDWTVPELLHDEVMQRVFNDDGSLRAVWFRSGDAAEDDRRERAARLARVPAGMVFVHVPGDRGRAYLAGPDGQPARWVPAGVLAQVINGLGLPAGHEVMLAVCHVGQQGRDDTGYAEQVRDETARAVVFTDSMLWENLDTGQVVASGAQVVDGRLVPRVPPTGVFWRLPAQRGTARQRSTVSVFPPGGHLDLDLRHDWMHWGNNNDQPADDRPTSDGDRSTSDNGHPAPDNSGRLVPDRWTENAVYEMGPVRLVGRSLTLSTGQRGTLTETVARVLGYVLDNAGIRIRARQVAEALQITKASAVDAATTLSRLLPRELAVFFMEKDGYLVFHPAVEVPVRYHGDLAYYRRSGVLLFGTVAESLSAGRGAVLEQLVLADGGTVSAKTLAEGLRQRLKRAKPYAEPHNVVSAVVNDLNQVVGGGLVEGVQGGYRLADQPRVPGSTPAPPGVRHWPHAGPIHLNEDGHGFVFRTQTHGDRFVLDPKSDEFKLAWLLLDPANVNVPQEVETVLTAVYGSTPEEELRSGRESRHSRLQRLLDGLQAKIDRHGDFIFAVPVWDDSGSGRLGQRQRYRFVAHSPDSPNGLTRYDSWYVWSGACKFQVSRRPSRRLDPGPAFLLGQLAAAHGGKLTRQEARKAWAFVKPTNLVGALRTALDAFGLEGAVQVQSRKPYQVWLVAHSEASTAEGAVVPWTQAGGGWRMNPHPGVPGHYRYVEYGASRESRLAQEARVAANDDTGTYGALTWRDADGIGYAVVGRSGINRHAEADLIAQMRMIMAGRDLSEALEVRLYVEYSPCETRPYYCRGLIERFLPQADVSYTWPWSPPQARNASKAARVEAIRALLSPEAR
jgi:hypothetical protein